MKKILSLVMAVAMLSTMAFAVDLDATGSTTVNPGKTLVAKSTNFSGGLHGLLVAANAELSSTNFSITKKSFSKGSALVKSVGFNDDDGTLEIKLNTNYELFAPAFTKNPNLIIDEIVISAKKALKDNSDVTQVARSSKYTYNGNDRLYVGYVKTTEMINNGSADYQNDQLVEFDGDAYGDATLNVGDITIEGRVYDGDKVYLNVDNKIGDDQKAILKNNENADLRFYNVTTNGLPSNNTILLYVEDDQFVYEIVDGKLTKSNLTWNADEYAFKGKIRSDKKYVVSDVELKATSTGTAGSENPDTGANDVVGVAAALAVVSVVAAAAVSLKK